MEIYSKVPTEIWEIIFNLSFEKNLLFFLLKYEKELNINIELLKKKYILSKIIKTDVHKIVYKVYKKS